MLVAVPSNHRLAKNRSLSIEDPANEPLVFYPRVERPQGFTDYLMRMFHSRNITPNIVQDVDAVVTAVSLVSSGLGLCLVEIGRATLWERVCLFVWILVVTVSVTQK